MITKDVKAYLAEIGRLGGKKSRRELDPATAKRMVHLREARKAYKKYYGQCFWSFDPNYQIQYEDVEWVSQQLMKNGDLKLWRVGASLCR